MQLIQTDSSKVLGAPPLVALFLCALILRLGYISLIWLLGGEFANESDSLQHINLALNLLEHGALVNQDVADFGREVGRMPLYTYFLAGIITVFSYDHLWVTSIIQAAIDASTVVSIGLIAGAINKQYAVLSSVIAAAWASLIVSASFILTDTIFMAFFCWGTYACLLSTRHKGVIRLLVLAGALFSCALLTRPTLMFFPYVLLPVLTLLLWRTTDFSWTRSILLATIPTCIMLISLVPWILINYSHYGSPVLTTQSGNHALDIVDQFIRLCEPCVSQGQEEKMHSSLLTLLENERETGHSNPVILDQIKKKVALRNLVEIPPTVLIVGVAQAAVRSLLQTGIYRTGHQLKLEPMFFSAIPDPSGRGRLIGLFREAIHSPYLSIWLLSQSVALCAFIFQVIGGITLFRNQQTQPYLFFLLFLTIYFLVVNGPFGNPRYSLPLAPTQIVLMAVGIFSVLSYLRTLCIASRHEAED